MNPADQERFDRIRRVAGFGYGITLKDLGWLVRLVEKLDRPAFIGGLDMASKVEPKMPVPFAMQSPRAVPPVGSKMLPQRPSMRSPRRRKK